MQGEPSKAYGFIIYLIKAPLLHFVLAGGVIFACYQAYDPENRTSQEHVIHVTPGRLTQLAAIFEQTWQRAPTKDELTSMVDDFVLEEIYYREAVSAGLDHNDTLIRRRLRQKMEFLTDDLAAAEPSDDLLLRFVQQNVERFQQPSTITFRQIFFNPSQLGGDAGKVFTEALAQLQQGGQPKGHPTLLPELMVGASLQQVSATFGKDFAEAIAGIEVGRWSQPVRSGYGMHLVRVDQRTPARLPEFASIRSAALREWEHERRTTLRKQIENELLSKYQVTIEWPQPKDSEG
ncbi:peptidyl-prolyl cis-trans isomerase [Alteromonas aestuariivivens]|nr:peptidylprolyl isomerase [Alteromonas aestuariivivens]